MKRRILPVLLALALLPGCGGSVPAPSEEPRMKELRVGLVCGGGEAEALLDARDRVTAALAEQGIAVTWQVETVDEDASCTQANRDCARAGCQLVVNSAPGMESLVTAAAADCPQTHFVTCGGSWAWNDTLENTHTAWARTYESAYLVGLALGEECRADGEEAPVVGYLAPAGYAQYVSPLTACFLGLRKVCPEAVMKVWFTGENALTDEEEEGARLLQEAGCGTIVYPEDRGTDIDWSVYLLHALETLAAGEELEQDWTGSLANGALALPDLLAGTPGERTVTEAAAGLKKGELEVFDTAAFTVRGEPLKRAYALDSDGNGIPDTGEAVYDGAYHECAYSSAPTFTYRIDGVEFLNMTLF